MQRVQRERERAAARDEKERARLYLEHRQAETAALNEELESRVGELQSVLHGGLGATAIDFDSLKQEAELKPHEPGWLAEALPAPVLELPPEPKGVGKLFGGMKNYATQVEQARREHAAAAAEHGAREQDRLQQLAAYEQQYEEYVQGVRETTEQQHAKIDEFRTRYEAAEAAAIVDYCTLVLESSRYPDGFPQAAKLAYVPESRQLVVEYDFPGLDVVPDLASHRYVKSGDVITPSPRPMTQRRAVYAELVASITLRTLHELFGADSQGHLDTVVFNGYVDAIDAGTGQPKRPCLVTVRVTRDAFDGLDLSRVEPTACLKALNASVSKNPSELVPVRPVLEFSMVDPRFVQETDVLSDLDQRPNLMELTPSEFESLITNLFEKMGLETRLTQPSRDGGVDCVAFDPRPIFGGKVVIQAKRYKHTVGVSAVRDLFGTMQNEGASKGILVTTSGYGKASFEFAEGKPLELLSGSNLLYLLAEHAGIEAKIEPPDDWQDPVPDTAP
jgi:restriction system protein